MLDVHTARPGIIEHFNPSTRRAIVRPAIDLLMTDGELKRKVPAVNVPVIFPSGGGITQTNILLPGDAVLVIFSERGLTEFKKTFTYARPDSNRLFSETDAICVPGFGPLNVKPATTSGSAWQTYEGDTSIVVKDKEIKITPDDDVSQILIKPKDILLMAEQITLNAARIDLIQGVSGTGTPPNAPTLPITAPLDSPAFTGTPTTNTPPSDSDDVTIPTTEWVVDKVENSETTHTHNFSSPAHSHTQYADVIHGHAGLAPLASPIFSGTPRAPAPDDLSSNTQIPTTKWVVDRISEASVTMSDSQRSISDIQNIVGAMAGTALGFDSTNRDINIDEDDLRLATGDAQGAVYLAKSDTPITNTGRAVTPSYLNSKLSHSHSYASTSHIHDSRYYTENEINNLLAARAPISHSHSVGSHTHSYAAPSHIHDDRYFTENEINIKLDGKTDVGHVHSAYINSGGVLNLLANYSQTSHIHDSRYYTENEINNKLALKAGIHSHPYAASSHSHSYASTSHIHDGRYYTENEINNKLALKAGIHSHPYASSSHSHPYAASNHTHAGVGSHIHDDRYFTENELNNKLALKAGIHSHPYASSSHSHSYASTSHIHDSRYYTENEINNLLALKSGIHSHPYAASSHSHSYAASNHTHSGSGTGASDLRNAYKGIWTRGNTYQVGETVTLNGSWFINIKAGVATDSNKPNPTSTYHATWRVISGKGDKGDTGAQGPQGPQGPAGTGAGTHSHSNYSSTSHIHDSRYYTENEINTKLNAKSNAGHSHSYAASNHTHSGSGTSNLRDAYKGIWTRGNVYQLGQTVTLDGSWFINISAGTATNSNKPDPSNTYHATWRVISGKGDKGDRGATGATGATGPQGPAGTAGSHSHSGYASSSHIHDSRYFTENEINIKLGGYNKFPGVGRMWRAHVDPNTKAVSPTIQVSNSNNRLLHLVFYRAGTRTDTKRSLNATLKLSLSNGTLVFTQDFNLYLFEQSSLPTNILHHQRFAGCFGEVDIARGSTSYIVTSSDGGLVIEQYTIIEVTG